MLKVQCHMIYNKISTNNNQWCETGTIQTEINIPDRISFLFVVYQSCPWPMIFNEFTWGAWFWKAIHYFWGHAFSLVKHSASRRPTLYNKYKEIHKYGILKSPKGPGGFFYRLSLTFAEMSQDKFKASFPDGLFPPKMDGGRGTFVWKPWQCIKR